MNEQKDNPKTVVAGYEPEIKMALLRFKEVLSCLDCECDDYNGYTCPLHNDYDLVIRALEIVGT